jgi:cell wall-associated NlpC family hydrolase
MPGHRLRLSRLARLIVAAACLAATMVQAAPGNASAAAMRAEQSPFDIPAPVPAEAAPAAAAELPAAAVPSISLADRMRDKASDMVITAMNFLGVPYKRGGSSAENGFDCSGFTRHIFEMSLGQVLPRRADEQASAPGLVKIKREDLKPGDLVFFNTLKRTFSHVGIYVGEGKFIHSPRTGGEVRVEDMRFAYWAKRFTGARRLEAALQPAASADIAGALQR